MIPETFIDHLKHLTDIVSVITPYAALKRAGRGHVCLCPFHSEKTPSCHVYTDTQSFFCFGCGAGGDAITFIRLIENIDYVEAVRLLAERAGLTVPESDNADGSSGKKKSLYLEMNKEAARFFRDMLHSEQGVTALEYLYRRGLTPNTIRKFGLGFALPGWDGLRNHMRAKNYHEDDLVANSLLARSAKGNVYDFFRYRVMFPIIDRRGNVISFSGRALDPDDTRKYINSAETLVFQKRLNLFGVNFAKNTAEKYMLLCEGNMDVVTLNQAGFENSVATCGTAITPEQARLLQQYCEQVVIAYDSDTAGQKAAEKAVNVLGQAGLTARVLEFPNDTKDPDDYIKLYGKEKFRALAENSRSVISYELKKAMSGINTDEPEGRAEYLRKAIVILAGIHSRPERAVYVSETARICQVQEQTLTESVNDRIRYNQKRGAKEERTKLIRGNTPRNIDGNSGLGLEQKSPEEGIIAYIFHSPDKLDKILSRLSVEDFPTEFYRRVLEMLVFRLKKGLSIDISALQSEFSPSEVGKIEAIKYKYSDVPYTDSRLEEYITGTAALTAKQTRRSPADMTAEELLEYTKALKNR
ncbi:MAG: DNA primase [Oscillospiraceae bacterium]|nr:DNA primase [Oscillospiraceae bacterium]